MILDELRKVASGLQGRCAPVPFDVAGVGEIGHLTREHGIYVNSAHRRPFSALLRDQERYERVARDVSGGIFGAELAGIARQMSDSADVVRTIKRMQGAITSWSGIRSAQEAGKSREVPYYKANQGAAVQWCSDFRTLGFPEAGAYVTIPGGSRFTGASTGAIPVGNSLGAGEHMYLCNQSVGVNSAAATVSGIIMTVDLLVAAGSISATSAVSQAITTTSLSRWTSGEGLCMTLEVTTALGATAATIALTYTDQAGNTANSTGAIALTTSAAAQRLLPVQDGPMIRFASDDSGVRQVEGCILSASMLAGVLAVLIYKPLRVMTVLGGLPTEMTTPVQTGGMKRLTQTTGGETPCITFLRYMSNGINIMGFVEVAWG